MAINVAGNVYVNIYTGISLYCFIKVHWLKKIRLFLFGVCPVVLNGMVVDGRISVNALPSGIYLIELKSVDGKSVMMTKFVKE